MSQHDGSSPGRPPSGVDLEGFPSSVGFGKKQITPHDVTATDSALAGPPGGGYPGAPPGGFALGDMAGGGVPVHEYTPPIPRTIGETGLPPAFLAELLVKHLYMNTELTGDQIAESVCLPFSAVLMPLLEQLKTEKFLEIKGGGSTHFTNTWRFTLTRAGVDKVQEIMARNQYAGPAPVPLKSYSVMVNRQFFAQGVTFDDVRHAFRELVVPDDLIEKVGSAVNSCKSLFLYGPPGNGKTSVAERICRMLRGAIFVPHAIEVHGQVIKVYDPLDHMPPEGGRLPQAFDRRWVFVKRPMIIVGGELTLAMLDLTWNTQEKFYEAPFQLKSNGGMLLIDDFGRQLVHPKDLLNRWIVPLEKAIDYLTLHTGQKFEAPFRQLVAFSTNMNPRDLVDEAFLRRLRYKIEISDPTEANYRAIVKRTCDAKGVAYTDDGLNYLINNKYRKEQTPMRACHPRDLVEIILDKARFMKCAPSLDPAFIDMCWGAYFVKY
jgi:predicted ATPase with chaperone activity